MLHFYLFWLVLYVSSKHDSYYIHTVLLESLTCLSAAVKYWYICRRKVFPPQRHWEKRTGLESWRKGRTRLDNQSVVIEIKAVDVENNFLCVFVCRRQHMSRLWMSLCVCVCLFVCVWQESRSSMYPCQGQGEPLDKLCVCKCVYVCVCYQGKPQLDPPEFSLSVLNQLKKKKRECGRTWQREIENSSPRVRDAPQCVCVCVCA